jgi:hypothetical protein
MVGPSAAVLLRETWGDADVAEFERWLGEGLVLEDVYGPAWYVRDPAWVQMSVPAVELGPILISAEGPFYEDPVEEVSMSSALGYLPGTEIVMAMGCTGDLNHRLLGNLTMMVARRYGGLVDLTGPMPIYPPSEVSRLDLDRMPGVRHEIEYWVGDDDYLSYLVVDVDFLAWWLTQPNFRMVK